MITNGYYNSYYLQSYYYIDNYYVDYGEYVSTASEVIYETIGMIRGIFNKDITIYVVTESVSTVTGENLKSESTGTTVRARVRPLTQFEIMRNSKRNLETTHRIYCDWSTEWDAGDRVVYNGDTYEIEGIIDPQELDKMMQMDVKYVS